MKHKLYIVIIVFLLIGAISTVLFLVIPSLRKIEIANNSQQFNATLNGPILEKLLSEWKFWNMGTVTLETMKAKREIKKIRINLVDKEQPYFKEGPTVNGKTVTRSSLNYAINNVGLLTITLYINPEFVSAKSEQDIAEIISFRVIERLYAISHNSQTDEQKFKNIVELFENAKKEGLPFSVKKEG